VLQEVQRRRGSDEKFERVQIGRYHVDLPVADWKKIDEEGDGVRKLEVLQDGSFSYK
jgi:hypothetical protein